AAVVPVLRYSAMPPRYAYWTILIDNGPTAFRAKEQSDLLPTLNQLRRTNKDVVMKWFSHGRLWESPEDARHAREKRPPRERRGADWRPGGEHKDPRARFGKPASGPRFAKPASGSRSEKPGPGPRFSKPERDGHAPAGKPARRHNAKPATPRNAAG